MTGRTHAAVGANTVWISMALGFPFTAWLIPIAALAALLPDLDASESMIKHLEFRVGSRRHGLRLKLFMPFALLFSSLFRHRGWLHSWAALAIVAALSFGFLGRFGESIPVVVTLGYFSHLVADALTVSGIEFLLPMRRSIRLLPKFLAVRTGGAVDTLLFIAASLGIAWMVYGVVQAT